MDKQEEINDLEFSKTARTAEGLFPLEKEYARTITALNRTGILTLLPRSENLGVIRIDGKEYAVPTQKQLQSDDLHQNTEIYR